jgi:hypothetical protein
MDRHRRISKGSLSTPFFPHLVWFEYVWSPLKLILNLIPIASCRAMGLGRTFKTLLGSDFMKN